LRNQPAASADLARDGNIRCEMEVCLFRFASSEHRRWRNRVLARGERSLA
jgi:hypothetical protein